MLAPELTSTDFAEYLEEPVDGDPLFRPNIYSRIGSFCYQAFVREDPRFKGGGIEHGFLVAARLVRYAAKLYPDYADENNINAEPGDLRKILHSSAQTPLRFANMPNTMNTVVESFFGLKSDSVPNHFTDLYRFESNTAHGTLFIADDEQFHQACADAESEMSVREYRRNKKCPMIKVTKEVVWPAMVDLAADTPEAFAYDLGLIDN